MKTSSILALAFIFSIPLADARRGARKQAREQKRQQRVVSGEF